MLVATNTRLSRQKMILVAAPANDTRYLVDGVENSVCLHQSPLDPVFPQAWLLGSSAVRVPAFLYWGTCSGVCAPVSHRQYVSHIGRMCLTWALCVSYGHYASHSCVCLTWVVCVSWQYVSQQCLTWVVYMSHMGSMCLTEVCVSRGQRASHVGSVCLTWVVCVSRG